MSEGSEDRTADLENRVAELEATVRGLTDELVDRTERIRALEREVGIVAGANTQSIITAGESDGAEQETDGGDPTAEADPESEETPAPENESDLLVPEPDEETAETDTDADDAATDETPTAEGRESTENESPSDDIIVA